MKADPIRLEIFKNRLSSIAEEMGAVLCRSAYSPNIKERRDASCAIFDATGEMVAQAAHIPVHLGSMPLSVQAALSSQSMEPGDTILLNDPYQGGTHLPDITMVSPVFGRNPKAPLFFVANRAHHADVGGMQPGSMPTSVEIFQEGLRIPPVKLTRKGKIQKDILNLFLTNVRTPEERTGDLFAQLAANRLGIRRLGELLHQSGEGQIRQNGRALLAYSEKMVRGVIRRIRDGTYIFQDFLEDDGIQPKPIRIKVAVRIRRSKASIDFTGTEAQAPGCVNAPLAVTLSSVFYVFCCLSGFDIPTNAGILRPIRVIAPEGTVVHAVVPAAVVGGNVELSQRIVDVLLGALAQALPDRIPAASSGSMNNVTIGGYDPFRKRHYTYYETMAGGMGARPTLSGLDGVHTHMTNTMNTPIEAIERAYPFCIKSYSIRSGSGGRGQFRGGNGLVREIEFLSDARVTILSERRMLTPYGLSGGEPGKAGKNILIRNGKKRKLPGKCSFSVRTGEILSVHTPGGGGFGKPIKTRKKRIPRNRGK